MPNTEAWPELHLSEWQPTRDTLHMWVQIVGHIRMALSPPVNHWWHSTLYLSARGLTTSLIPAGGNEFEIEFDFLEHQLRIATSHGGRAQVALAPKVVADFYAELMQALGSFGIVPKIHSGPDEVADPIPFAQDRTHRSYDEEYAKRWWRAMLSTEAVLREFRSRFLGKCSPVHLFWGAMDLCCTRFSGRRAPPRPGADAVQSEAYSHEVISAGFWPGGGAVNDAAFYAYAAPEPEGFRQARKAPAAAFYHQELGEFILMYDDVRRAAEPAKALMAFLESTYNAGAELGKWDRAALERPAK